MAVARAAPLAVAVKVSTQKSTGKFFLRVPPGAAAAAPGPIEIRPAPPLPSARSSRPRTSPALLLGSWHAARGLGSSHDSEIAPRDHFNDMRRAVAHQNLRFFDQARADAELFGSVGDSCRGVYMSL